MTNEPHSEAAPGVNAQQAAGVQLGGAMYSTIISTGGNRLAGYPPRVGFEPG
jgi:hypothetical protein